MSSGSNASLPPKTSSSGRNFTSVPEPRALPSVLNLDVTSPRANFISWRSPSRFTCTTSSADSAFTTAEPTPCRPPDTA